jgi:hypothetical protein
MSSQKKIDANRKNSKESTGPIDTTSTRRNAEKHRLLSKGFTELDDLEYCERLSLDLIQRKKPVGMFEEELIERAVYDMVGWKRAQVAEGQYITDVLNPALREKNVMADLDIQFNGAVIDPGIPAPLGVGSIREITKTFQRYQACFSNRVFRTIHELEREQRMRTGESLPAPIVVDVSVGAGRMHDGSNVPSAPHADAEGCGRVADLPTGSAVKETSSTKSEQPEATICENANRQHPIVQDADVRACDAVAGRPDDLHEEEISPPDLGTFVTPDVNIDQAGSGGVKKTAEPWRPPAKDGPLWSQ